MEGFGVSAPLNFTPGKKPYSYVSLRSLRSPMSRPEDGSKFSRKQYVSGPVRAGCMQVAP
jgi:hypothetical protein